MWRIRHYFLHDIFDFGELVHEVDFVVQTSRSINQHHIRIVGLSTRDGIKCHTGRIGALLLLHDRHAHSFAPDTELLHRRSAESVSSAQIDFLARLFVLMRELANGGGFAHTIHTHYHNHIGFAWERVGKIKHLSGIILRQKRSHFIHQNSIQLTGTKILITLHTLLNTFDDTEGSLHAHIRRDERLFQIIQDIVIHG